MFTVGVLFDVYTGGIRSIDWPDLKASMMTKDSAQGTVCGNNNTNDAMDDIAVFLRLIIYL